MAKQKSKTIKSKLASSKRKPDKLKKKAVAGGLKTKKRIEKASRKMKSVAVKNKNKAAAKTKTKIKIKKVAKQPAALKTVHLHIAAAKPKKVILKKETSMGLPRSNGQVAVSSSKVIVKQKKYKPNRKTKYSKSELKHFRDIILQERKMIFESAKANMDALVDKDSGEYKGDDLTYSSHMAEQGTDEMEREKNYLFVQRDEKYLGYLQEALTRIDQGTYGICIDCKDDPKNLCRSCPLIAKERLELVPITQHCIECKNLRG